MNYNKKKIIQDELEKTLRRLGRVEIISALLKELSERKEMTKYDLLKILGRLNRENLQ